MIRFTLKGHTSEIADTTKTNLIVMTLIITHPILDRGIITIIMTMIVITIQDNMDTMTMIGTMIFTIHIEIVIKKGIFQDILTAGLGEGHLDIQGILKMIIMVSHTILEEYLGSFLEEDPFIWIERLKKI